MLIINIGFNLSIISQYRKEGKDIANNLKDSTAYPDLRDMTESIYGTWYTYCDSNLIAYSGKYLT